MVFKLSEAERRMNVESRLLMIVSGFGGERIISGEPMEAMVKQLADQAESLAREGFLPEPTDGRVTD